MKRLSLAFQARKYLRTVLPLCAFLLVSVSLLAQTRTVTGTLIDDASGEPLIGASIIVKGSTVGTVTDFDGSFSIEAAPEDVLVVSYVGYADQEIVVGNSSNISINLSQGVLVDEIVVTGYQSQRKRDITGAVAVVSGEDLNVVSSASVSQKLAGKASGVTISTSGSPGDGTAIRIRGFNSLGNNDPLIVIDGVPTRDTYLNSINPNDIESIQVLKDAASSTIYGARASNGVIVITTKKGKPGKTKVSYNGYYGTQNPVNKFDLITDPAKYREYVQKAANATAGQEVPAIYQGTSFPEYYNGDPSQAYNYPDNLLYKPNVNGTDWWEETIGPAALTEHNVNISGGSENSTFSITGNYYDQGGTIKHTYFTRYMARANSSFKKGRLTFGENISLSRIKQNGQRSGNQSEQNIITNIIRTQNIVPVLDEGGNFAGPKAIGMGLGNNPAKGVDDEKDDFGQFHRMFGNMYGSVDILDGLSARSSIGFDYGTGYSQNATFPNFEAREPNQFTFNFSENWNNNFEWTWSNTLNLVKTVGDIHDFNAVVGVEANNFRSRNIGASLVDYFVFGLDSRYLNSGLADPASQNVGSGGSVSRFASEFAKVDYTYDDFILVSGSLRRDRASQFGPDNRVGIFPAGSIGVRLTKFLNVDAIDDLKVRYSYGINGNNAIASDNAFELFGGSTGNSFYDINGTNSSIATGYALQRRGNSVGGWEELVQSNFGIDASFLGGRFGLVLDVFNKTTRDLLFTAALPATGGSAGAAARNIAEMKNNGIDGQLWYRDRLGSNIDLDLGLTFGTYRNEITKVSDGQTQFFANGGSRIGAVSINRVGHPVGSFYGYETDGIFGSDAEVDSHADQAGKAIGRIRFKDQNGDGVINDDDRIVLGSYHPSFTGGLNIGLGIGKIDFSAFIFGKYGNEIYNFNKLFTDFSQFEANIRNEVLDNHWSPTNTGSNIPAPDYAGRAFNNQSSDYYVEDASYTRLENIQIGYDIGDMIGAGRARIYIQGQNLLTLTGYSGLDPAMSEFGIGVTGAGIDFGNYPSNKSVMVGVNLEF